MFGRRFVALVATMALSAGLAFVPPAAAAEEHTVTHTKVTSQDGSTQIAISVFKPAGASATNLVPVVLSSHGWAGARHKTIAPVKPFLDAGMGVVSIDQRGHGESGGQANVQDPDLEPRDIMAVIDFVAFELDWVRHDVDSKGERIPEDPVLGAIGGSYGGGYQFMTALFERWRKGSTRFNALAPEITWHDLPESLAPQGVARTAWLSLLYAAGARMVPQYIHESFAYGTATGQWPDGTVPGTFNLNAEFYEHSPKWFSDRGLTLEIPTLIRQGTSDTLFNLNQGIHNFQKVLSNSARDKSLFVGYNGGHVLPSAFPAGYAAGSDVCSGGFTQLTIAFFQKAFAGEDPSTLLPNSYNLTASDGASCIRTDSLDSKYADFKIDPVTLGGWGTTTGAGAPQHIELASSTDQNPITVAGIPKISFKLYSAAADARAFFALSVGTSIADAKVIQNNMMPVRSLMPSIDAPYSLELPAVAAKLKNGEKLFLTISPISDMSFGHGSRIPGVMVFSNLKLKVPTL